MRFLNSYEKDLLEMAKELTDEGYGYEYFAYACEDIDDLIELLGITDTSEVLRKCYYGGAKNFYDNGYIFTIDDYENIKEVYFEDFKKELNDLAEEIEENYKELEE